MKDTMAQLEPECPSKSEQDAITVLTEDHEKVRKMFRDFERLNQKEGNDHRKRKLVQQIWTEITIHAQVEEEIFYPAVRDAIDDDTLLDVADVEHSSFKELIAQIDSMGAGNPYYDAKVMALGEYIDHHIKEEQDEMFARIKKAKLDTVELGARILRRKKVLQDDR
jgi:hemerythrin superfamily protein